MNKEEILKGLEDIKQFECNPEYKAKVINGMLELYNKEIIKYKKLNNEFLITLSEHKRTLEKITQLRDSLNMFAYSDVIEKLDEILED